ncbi:TetR/AcrR family transcriptional regulator [Paenibacillus sepulcri]|uniref:TetR/AcrR family transcriptional regulator n=1 Tax=Paenibacillus sepulcri TaxID=359917 RepID=A0ABS7CAS5_9BACL|nr:TetR/AcrR family transcriptional regulator [Paenibacillus sepulcri]
MSKLNIQKAALSHFARSGYEGASLSQIADEVGIKKPSIYAHYKGKDDLFLHVVRDVFHTVQRRILEYFQARNGEPVEDILNGLFGWIRQEYEQDDAAKCLLRMVYFPPDKLYQEIADIANPFIDGMQRKLISYLRQSHQVGTFLCTDYEEAAVAYITLVDGAIIELIYGGPERYGKRVQAAWLIYWRGVTSQTGRDLTS